MNSPHHQGSLKELLKQGMAVRARAASGEAGAASQGALAFADLPANAALRNHALRSADFARVADLCLRNDSPVQVLLSEWKRTYAKSFALNEQRAILLALPARKGKSHTTAV